MKKTRKKKKKKKRKNKKKKKKKRKRKKKKKKEKKTKKKRVAIYRWFGHRLTAQPEWVLVRPRYENLGWSAMFECFIVNTLSASNSYPC